MEFVGKSVRASIIRAKGDAPSSFFVTERGSNLNSIDCIDELADNAPIILRYLPHYLVMQGLVLKAAHNEMMN